MATSEFTVFQGVDVLASDDLKFRGKALGPVVQVSFPDPQWDRITFYRPYPSLDEARIAARELAEALRAHRPKTVAGLLSARLAAKDPAQVAARREVEAAVRAWAGDDCVVHSVS